MIKTDKVGSDAALGASLLPRSSDAKKEGSCILFTNECSLQYFRNASKNQMFQVSCTNAFPYFAYIRFV
jgi:hypothetical protein